MSKHLGTFNLFREADGGLWVTVADAHGIREELGGNTILPMHAMALNALYEGVRQMKDREVLKAWQDKYPTPAAYPKPNNRGD